MYRERERERGHLSYKRYTIPPVFAFISGQTANISRERNSKPKIVTANRTKHAYNTNQD